jgi:hypothetical protein
LRSGSVRSSPARAISIGDSSACSGMMSNNVPSADWATARTAGVEHRNEQAFGIHPIQRRDRGAGIEAALYHRVATFGFADPELLASSTCGGERNAAAVRAAVRRHRPARGGKHSAGIAGC